MNKLPLDYIAGLIDADGSFSISLSDRRYKGNALTVHATVNVRQLEKYRPVLEDILETLGLGKIYQHGDKMATWQTVKMGDAVKVAKILYPHLHVKKEICKNFFTILEEWSGKDFNHHSSRNKHQLTRPRWLIEKMMDVAMNLNAGQQTKTAYENKRKRVEAMKARIAKFYKV